MARKIDLITDIYRETSKQITSSPQAWTAFLRSACRNFRLRFDEQVLVFAQRPDAVAVLEIERWNKQYGRWVNRGAKGIAVFESADRSRQRLQYYFDISDTHPGRLSRPVPLWQMKPEYETEVIEILTGEENVQKLPACVVTAAKNIVEDNIFDYEQELHYAARGSALEGQGISTVASMYRQLVTNSVAYMLLSRLDLNPDQYFMDDAFQDIVNFDTPAAQYAVGIATSDIAEVLLSEIARTILALEKKNRTFAKSENIAYNNATGERETERSLEYERDQIHDAGRLSAPESETARSAGSDVGALRVDAQEVSSGAPQNPVRDAADELQADGASGRNRAESTGDGRIPDGADGGTGGLDRGAQSERHDAMGSGNEQSQEQGTGNRGGGGHLHLDYYDREHEDKSLPNFGGDDTIREILGTTPYLKASKDEIRAFYEGNPDNADRTEYIKEIFNNDFTELILSDGRRVGYKMFQNVLQLWEGSYLSRTKQSFYDWGVIAQYFEAMRLLGELQDTIKPLPSMDGQLNILEMKAEEKTSAFSFSQEIIDTVLARGSGVSEGKFRIFEQFQKSLSAKENATFLKDEYGWGASYPAIVGAGIEEQHDGKGILISKGIGADKPHIRLTWKQVEKRIGELIRLDRYLSPIEKENYPQWLEKQEERRAEFAEERKNREILSSAPPENETEQVTESESQAEAQYAYHLGDTVYIGAEEYTVLAIQDSDIVLSDAKFPLFQKRLTLAEFDRLLRESPLNDHLRALTVPDHPLRQEDYRLLDRLKADCDYFLDAGGRVEKHLWAGNARDQISKMRELYDSLPDKPEWLTSEDIDRYARRMAPPYEVVVYHRTENGFDERMDYQTLSDAEQAAKKYVDGSMDGENGFAYDGAAVYDLQANKWLRVYGDFPDEKAIEQSEHVFAAEGQPDGHGQTTEQEEKHTANDTKTAQDTSPAASYEDAFFLDDDSETITWMYYNPDSNAGGQYVTNTLSFDEVREAAKKYQSADDFFDYLGSIASQELADIGSEWFESAEAEFHKTPDLTDCVAETMDTLVAQAESAKVQSNRQSEYYRDYLDIKAKHPNSLVLYQMGDFFESYSEDAKAVRKALELNLTSRAIGNSQRTELCGFPAKSLENYLNMLLDRGFDVAVSSLENGERSTRNIVSTNKEDPVQSQPIGRIDYLHTDGTVRESVEYTSLYRFEKDIKEENYYGVPMTVVFYKDKDGNTIPQDFVNELDPPPQRVSVIDSPYLLPLSEEPERQSAPLPPPQPVRRQRVTTFDLHPEIPLTERHTFNLAAHPIEAAGKKERFRRNMAATTVLKECEFEHRFATPEEQLVLSKYVGWGGLPEAFDENNAAWADEFAELYTALSPEEYAAARESTLTAFFTPPEVISAVYKVLERMGLHDGNILEPACGIGHFIGMLPAAMQDCRVYGVEIDPISANIARQLYQKSSIAAQPFEDTSLPDSFFDAVVGNVPFGDFKVSDKRYDKYGFLIHDYFFAKSLDKLRPGGVMALLTSKGTMDKANPSVRKYIAQRADLLGAVRLPNNTFGANAGTEVVSDILFLQKRDRLIDIEPEWVYLSTDEKGFTMNEYFVDHPEMVLGEWKTVSGRFGEENTVVPYENTSLSELLEEAISNIHAEITEYEMDEELAEEDNSIPADPTVRNFSYTLVDDKIYYRENSRMFPVVVSATANSRIKGMIAIRDSARSLIELQTEDYPDTDIHAEQERLNALYDTFTAKYGLLNSRANRSAFSQDSSFPLLSGLEVIDDDGSLLHKADLFTKRTIRPRAPITSVDTASEALTVSIAEKAGIDMEYMSSLSGKTEEELFAELKGVIFLNPLYGYGNSSEAKYLTADEYLSGNVREKLKAAQKSAELYPEDYSVNVEALEKVQPKDLSAGEISVRLGATWLPVEVINQFIYAFLDTPVYARPSIKAHFSKATGEWNIEGKSYDRGNIKAHSTYGTKRINAYKIIEETLNLKTVRIFDYIEDEKGKKKAVFNARETAIAQSKQEAIKQGFQDWIWQDPVRREKLVRLYNDKFNSNRPREYDGSHINFVGMNPEIELREHQRNAVAHILYGGDTLLAHAVGAGKTYEMVAAAMELKRLGLCNKSLFVVPNHLTEQWAAEFLLLYPAANILVATKKDFETQNRKRFCARISTGDYDAVIIGHSQFEKIPMSLERQRALLEQELDDITAGIQDLRRNRGDSFSIKQLERTRKGLKLQLQKLNDQSKKDDVVTFEELGVDQLFVDESHYYKNLFLYSKMRNVGGISQTGANKSSDLYAKCRYLSEVTGGRGVVFATGTPISNSMVELYTIQRYLQYDTLVKHDLQYFDAWASTFGETVSAIELNPEGTGYRMKTRFARFYNLPELMAMFREVADIQTSDQLNLPVPTARYHNIAVKPSEIQKDLVASLSKRADKVRAGEVPANEDNMLLITNDGRKLALDQRLVNDTLPDFEGSKVNACVEKVFQIWYETTEQKSTQLIFCDLSTPKSDGTFSVYTDIRKKLIELGVPENEIRFIHDADTEAKKTELFKKMRRGDIRILLGSTQKLGAGTNVQDKLIALHDLDCPWRPADLEQRSGRIIRQGNENKEVDIYRYVTEQTFDAYLYQLVEGKQKFASQIMTSKSPVRSAEDIDETALSYAEIKMLATGNPHIKEKMDLDIQVQKLNMLKSSFLTEKYMLEDKVLHFYPQEISRLNERISGYTADLTCAEEHAKPDDGSFPGMEVCGTVYEEKAAAGEAILNACRTITSSEPVPLGSYRGFSMELFFDPLLREYVIQLKGMLSYNTPIGSDVHGNITRLDNTIDGISKRLKLAVFELENTEKQLENAKESAAKPFPQEEELKAKTERLNELNALLNVNKRENEFAADAPNEDAMADRCQSRRAAPRL